MEDAATAEISRTQIWQWLKHECILDNGEQVNIEMIDKIFILSQKEIQEEIGNDRFSAGKFDLAVDLFKEMIYKDTLDEFLTLPAYQYI